MEDNKLRRASRMAFSMVGETILSLNMTMSSSAVMLTKNTASLLPISVVSVQARSYPRVEIVIVNDGSGDGTPAARGHEPWHRSVDQPGDLTAVRPADSRHRPV